MMKEDQEGINAQAWGFPKHPRKYLRSLKRLSLGMPKASPSSSTIIRSSPLKLCFYSFTYYVQFLERLSVLFFLFVFVFVCLLVFTIIVPIILVWERNTLWFLIERSLCFTYIF